MTETRHIKTVSGQAEAERIAAPKESTAIKFTTYQYADVSTEHLTPNDCKHFKECHCRFAEVDGGYGTFFNVPAWSETFSEDIELWHKHGMSDHFVSIMSELSQQRIEFVRFDEDGAIIEGWPILSR